MVTEWLLSRKKRWLNVFTFSVSTCGHGVYKLHTLWTLREKKRLRTYVCSMGTFLQYHVLQISQSEPSISIKYRSIFHGSDSLYAKFLVKYSRVFHRNPWDNHKYSRSVWLEKSVAASILYFKCLEVMFKSRQWGLDGVSKSAQLVPVRGEAEAGAKPQTHEFFRRNLRNLKPGRVLNSAGKSWGWSYKLKWINTIVAHAWIV
jgi:hypothetical protein